MIPDTEFRNHIADALHSLNRAAILLTDDDGAFCDHPDRDAIEEYVRKHIRAVGYTLDNSEGWVDGERAVPVVRRWEN